MSIRNHNKETPNEIDKDTAHKHRLATSARPCELAEQTWRSLRAHEAAESKSWDSWTAHDCHQTARVSAGGGLTDNLLESCRAENHKSRSVALLNGLQTIMVAICETRPHTTDRLKVLRLLNCTWPSPKQQEDSEHHCHRNLAQPHYSLSTLPCSLSTRATYYWVFHLLLCCLAAWPYGIRNTRDLIVVLVLMLLSFKSTEILSFFPFSLFSFPFSLFPFFFFFFSLFRFFSRPQTRKFCRPR